MCWLCVPTCLVSTTHLEHLDEGHTKVQVGCVPSPQRASKQRTDGDDAPCVHLVRDGSDLWSSRASVECESMLGSEEVCACQLSLLIA